MAKYHISPTTGRPNQCYAKRQCPFGGEADHYPSKEAAREAYEASMSGETVAPVAKKKAEVVEDPQDVTTWKPVTVDTKLAELYAEAAMLRARRDSDQQFLIKEVARQVYNRGYNNLSLSRAEYDEGLAKLRAMTPEELNYNQKRVLEYAERLEVLNGKLKEANAAMDPYNEEFQRRGGWNRAFLVSNGNGHVHKSMNCSTCFPTTQYHWVTEYSDHDEQEIVEAAGERACTVCYPSAPVNVLNRPTQLFTPDEVERQKAREERATAAQKKKEETLAKALTPDGSPFKVEFVKFDRPDKESFKTERSAVSWAVGNMADFKGGWLKDREMHPSMVAANEAIMQAVADKHGKSFEEVKKEFETKTEARIKAYERELKKAGY